MARWLEPTLIENDNLYTLQAAALEPIAYRINLKKAEDGPPDEYLLIENRQKIGFDEDLWGEGIIITHVDDAAPEMERIGYPGQDGWPENGYVS